MKLLLTAGHLHLYEAGASRHPGARASVTYSQGSPYLPPLSVLQRREESPTHGCFALRSTKSGLWALACQYTSALAPKRDSEHACTYTHKCSCVCTRSHAHLLSLCVSVRPGSCCTQGWFLSSAEPHLRKDKEKNPTFLLQLRSRDSGLSCEFPVFSDSPSHFSTHLALLPSMAHLLLPNLPGVPGNVGAPAGLLSARPHLGGSMGRHFSYSA